MSSAKKWWLFGGLGTIIVSLYFLNSVLTPFLTAALLAYLGNPLVNCLMRYKVPRTLAVAIVFIILFSIVAALLVLLIPLLEKQIILFIQTMPGIFKWLQTAAIPWLKAHTGIGNVFDLEHLQDLISKNWQEAGNLMGTVLKTVTYSGYTIFTIMLNLILIPVVTFYLLRDWELLIKGFHGLIPRPIESTAVRLTKQCNEVIGAFFRGQLLVMLSLGIYYAITLTILGIQLSLLIGFIIGLVGVVPYLGFFVGIFIAAIATLIQFHDGWHLVYLAIIFGVGQALESYILSPLLVGDRIGLHPVAVIFSVLAGGELFGFIGVLLALPVAAIIMVLLRYTRERYFESELYGANDG